jgi:nitrogen fixation protein NifQ
MFADHYESLMAARSPSIDADAAFDRHALACVLAVARDENLAGRASLSEATGLGSEDLARVIAHCFPGVPADVFGIGGDDGSPVCCDEEELLHDLLRNHADPHLSLSSVFARIVSRRAMRDDHLWQDLGLFERPELTRLLNRHFPQLAAGNTRNMKWKKYFYRCLCEAEGFSLCTAPSCRECNDFDVCFGEEVGMSHLARLKNGFA